MKIKEIIIKNARENNLKNVNLKIPHNQLVVFTGVSGSGKSSLAFDTIFAEGQRRYLQAMSSYARQFLGQAKKADVDDISGLCPTIAIDQKTTYKSPRSTVGTVTEIYDFLRLLYAQIGTLHCPICGDEIRNQSIDEIVDSILQFPEGSKIQILAPVVKQKKGSHTKELAVAKKNGFTKARIDGNFVNLTDEISLDKNKKHDIDIVVDRLIVNKKIKSRLTDSLEVSFKLASGLTVVNLNKETDVLFSQHFACPKHNFSIEKLTPQMFSFNNPYGACSTCMGLGSLIEVSKELIVPDETLSIKDGAIQAPGWKYREKNSFASAYYEALAEKFKFSLDVPFKNLPKKIKDILFYGLEEKIKIARKTKFMDLVFDTSFNGIVNNLKQRYRESKSDWVKKEIEKFMCETKCPTCDGKRLKPALLGVTIMQKNISEFADMTVLNAIDFVNFLKLNLTKKSKIIAESILKEIKSRLEFLKSVGLPYLTLNRSSKTLSGGESQRIRLATQIGSALVGVLYILDEPSIGLHKRDTKKLISSIKKLRDLGNSIIVVEHDEETIKTADFLVEIGPKAGNQGGKIIFSGPVEQIKNCKESITGQYLAKIKKIDVPQTRRKGNGNFLEFLGCCENNLKNINVKFRLGTFTCITGVSGSGKSSLINKIVFNHFSSKFGGITSKIGNFKEVKGDEHINKVVCIDQSPIGKTPRSNPGTYTGVFDNIRELFANTNYAKLHGFTAGRFSFNVKGGRCEACKGDGVVKIEMHFLPDIFVPCEVCEGRRYNRETLKVTYNEKNIFDVLEMTVETALSFFNNQPRIKRKLQCLADVGLGYVKIGQSASTLSGGEAQRVKLANELSKIPTGKTLYIIDEMSTGLHVDDVKKILQILQKLVDKKNTVLLIEHNLEVIKTADEIIDLGPEGGDEGGYIVATGTPEEIAQTKESYTGKFLKNLL